MARSWAMRRQWSADEHLELRFSAYACLRDHVIRSEPRQENLAGGRPVAIIRDNNRAVGGLEAVGIGDALLLVEHESALPRVAVGA